MLSYATEGDLEESSMKMSQHPTRFWVNELNRMDRGSRGITLWENQSDAQQEVGRTHSSDEGRASETENLHRWIQEATLSRENSTEQRSSSLDRVEVNSTITPIGSKEDTRTVSIAEMAIKRSLVTAYEDSGTTAASRNRWRQ